MLTFEELFLSRRPPKSLLSDFSCLGFSGSFDSDVDVERVSENLTFEMITQEE